MKPKINASMEFNAYEARKRAAQRIREYNMKKLNVMDCMECRCCEAICSSKIPLLSKIKAGKAAVRELK